jgi:hypothetical protein
MQARCQKSNSGSSNHPGKVRHLTVKTFLLRRPRLGLLLSDSVQFKRGGVQLVAVGVMEIGTA